MGAVHITATKWEELTKAVMRVKIGAMKPTLIAIPLLCLFYTLTSGSASPRIEQHGTISLLSAFRSMSNNTSSTPEARPVKSVKVTQDYDVRQHSVITAARLDQFLGGVLRDKGYKIIQEARKNKICPITLAAIAMHESTNGTSRVAREKNNVFGIFLKGKLHKFKNVDDSIEFTADLLSRDQYCGGKNYTIGKIQKLYCPVGAKNDPSSLNKHWLGGVLRNMKKLWGESIYVTV